MKTLIGKTVKIRDASILCCLYPGFEEREFFSSIADKGKRIIYIGEVIDDLKMHLRRTTEEFINTVGEPDIDLDDRNNMAQLVYSKWGMDFINDEEPETVDFLLKMDENSFFTFMKRLWFIGPSIIKYPVGVPTVQELVTSLWGSERELVEKFYKMSIGQNLVYLEGNVIGFIHSAYSTESNYKSTNSKKFSATFNEEYIAEVLAHYRKMSRGRKVKLLWLLTELQSYLQRKGG